MRVDVLSTAGIKSWGAMPATELEQSAKATGDENGSATVDKVNNGTVNNGAIARVKANGLRRQSTKVFSAVGGV